MTLRDSVRLSDLLRTKDYLNNLRLRHVDEGDFCSDWELGELDSDPFDVVDLSESEVKN